MKLKKDFFNRNTLIVARELLGKYLMRRLSDGRIGVVKITETEAYHGPKDKASHASHGQTKRTEIMFGQPGFLYVYLIYGRYHCLNLVTMPEGYPAAVLIRGGEVIQKFNTSSKRPTILDGPGKLCRELCVDRTLNGLDLKNTELWVEDRGIKIARSHIFRDKRIGIDYAGNKWKNKLWRFKLY